jgi:hypothetical protein
MAPGKLLRVLSILSMVAAVAMLYLGAYCAMLSPLPIRPEKADTQPFYDCRLFEYGEFQAQARMVFAPVHALDRLLRPAKWERGEP